jgi:hypothetical protein
MPTAAHSGAPPRSQALEPAPTAVYVVPFSAADDSAVSWAVKEFDRSGHGMLLIFHPDPHGVTAAELAEVRDRFAAHLAGRYRVSVGHPHAPQGEWYPALRFVRAG